MNTNHLFALRSCLRTDHLSPKENVVLSLGKAFKASPLNGVTLSLERNTRWYSIRRLPRYTNRQGQSSCPKVPLDTQARVSLPFTHTRCVILGDCIRCTNIHSYWISTTQAHTRNPHNNNNKMEYNYSFVSLLTVSTFFSILRPVSTVCLFEHCLTDIRNLLCPCLSYYCTRGVRLWLYFEGIELYT